MTKYKHQRAVWAEGGSNESTEIAGGGEDGIRQRCQISKGADSSKTLGSRAGNLNSQNTSAEEQHRDNAGEKGCDKASQIVCKGVC